MRLKEIPGNMLPKTLILFLAVWSAGTAVPCGTIAGTEEISRVQSAAAVLSEIMEIPEDCVPPSLLNNSRAVAIIPGMLKAGFVIGGRYGEGVLMVRNSRGRWGNPLFVRIYGGSVGWQVGAQATDVILVFKTMRGVDAVTSGKFTLGLDASVAAGPVGRHAEAGTDVQLRAEILSYSRSRGLFAGVALEGAAIQIDYGANAAFYALAGLLPAQIIESEDLEAPSVAWDLRQVLTRYADS